MEKSKLKIGVLVLVIASLSACSFEEGRGGDGAIQGKVYVEDYNGSGALVAEGYAPDWNVFIQYGADTIVGDKTETSFNGTYLFDELHEGSYKVYAYSQCDTCPNGRLAIVKEVTLAKDELVIVEDIEVLD